MRFGINPTIQITGRSTDMAITAHDIVSDSPTNNFCTLNPLAQFGSPSISEGNLEISLQATSADGCFASMLPVTQKYYWETLLFSGIQGYGLMENTSNAYNDHHTVYYTDGRIYVNGSLITNGATTATSVDVIGVAFDPVAQTIQFFKNNSLIGSYSTTGNGLLPSVVGTGNGAGVTVVNFGQDPTFAGNKNTPATVNINGTNVTGPFAPSGTAAGTAGLFYYPPPAGAKALCTANLPDFTPTVTDDIPADYFTVRKWHNNVDNVNQDFDLGFDADLLWVKRTNGTDDNRLYDSLRGANNFLVSNSADTSSSVDYGIYFLNGDQKLTTDSTKYYGYGPSTSGGSGNAFVARCFRAGGPPSGSTSTTGSAKRINTSGTQDDTSCSALATAATNAGASNVITPTLMSINQAAGFSIVKYVGDQGTGSTVPHGLLEAPQIVIVKPLNGAVVFGWRVYTEMTGNTKYLLLNTYDQAGTYTDWNSTSPTSNVFTVNSSDAQTNNQDGTDYIAYCWHSVEGYSKFGSYTGNGSTDGPFVYCGFRPAFVMYKNIDSSSNEYASWGMIDSSRSSYNPTGGPETLWANRSTQEGYRGNGTTLLGANDFLNFDFVSNGFKPRGSGGNTETNDTQEYIFMAFAEQPFKYANAR